MKSYFTIRWDSTTSHGGHSFGHIGQFVSRQEAESACRKEEVEFALASERQPLADTSFVVVRVEVDQYGNQEEKE